MNVDKEQYCESVWYGGEGEQGKRQVCVSEQSKRCDSWQSKRAMHVDKEHYCEAVRYIGGGEQMGLKGQVYVNGQIKRCDLWKSKMHGYTLVAEYMSTRNSIVEPSADMWQEEDK